MIRTWPVTLEYGDVRLRPLRVSDAGTWRELRRRNAEWLRPWDATLPPEGAEEGESPPTFGSMVRRLRREARAGRMLPWALEYQGRLVGQLTVGGIAWGSLRGAYVGYWIDSAVAGRGVMPVAVALASASQSQGQAAALHLPAATLSNSPPSGWMRTSTGRLASSVASGWSG